ncbi:MAG: recombination-associated protein RdgC [Hydrogenophaga sp.]|nr:recombination-associated protein RdgC [Hydrogenophaga sp.]
MFKALTIYRLAKAWYPEIGLIEASLDAARFTPCGATQDKSMGWIAPRGEDHGALAESVNGQVILRLAIETKSVPGEAVRKEADAAAEHIEQTTGRKPGKKQMKELREDALLNLLPAAFPKRTDVLVWIDRERGLLMTDASSQGKIDDVITMLVRASDDLNLTLLNTVITPQTAMTAWLSTLASDDEDGGAPGEFSIERECELKSGGEEKSVVKFTRHNLATDEVRKHITEGKLPTKVAMSWNGRVAFVLTEAMALKKIDFLEGVFDDSRSDSADSFEADVALSTGELRQLIPALVDALGGELVISAGLPVAPEGGDL